MSEVPGAVPDSPAAPAHLGQQLARAREDFGMSIVDVARQLKLSPWQVEAMETGDYGRLPAAVFVRGFIRNYARLVKVDSAELLAGVEQQLAPAKSSEQELPNSVNIPFPPGRKPQWHKYAMVGVLVVALLVMVEFHGNNVTEVAVEPHPVVPLHPVVPPHPEVVAAEKDAAAGAVPQVSGVSDAAAESASETFAVRATSAASDKPATLARATESQPKPHEHLLKLRFDRESWVEIRDRNGHRIFSQLNSAGTEQAVSGLPPLSLVVGNAVGVHLTHNDQPVNLIPHIKVDVARLTLE